MKLSVGSARSRRAPFSARAVGIAVVASAMVLVGGAAQAATPPPPLGTAKSFAVLAGQAITNTGPTVITGDVGLHPGTAIDGGMTVTGTTHATDAVALAAKNDLVTAYNVAASAAPTSTVTAALGGQSLVAGVYRAPSVMQLTGALTLDAAGDPSAVFIFQAGSELVADNASSIVLTGGAQACNVFWQVGSSATVGTTSTFVGSILALASITLNTGATLEGRALAQTAAVNLHDNVIRVPNCEIADAANAAAAQAAADVAAAQAAADAAAVQAAADATAASASQITVVPVGSVSTGDGSSLDGPNDASGALMGLVLIVAVGGVVAVARRRRSPA